MPKPRQHPVHVGEHVARLVQLPGEAVAPATRFAHSFDSPTIPPAPRILTLPQRRAKITYPNGDTFDGTFNADKAKHGHGKYVWTKELGEEGPKNAWVPLNEEGDAAALPETRVIAYDGGYKDGLRHGIGRMTYPNGDVYHGAWEAGTPNGQGTYYYASGDLYSGQWKAGKKEGRGAYVYKADDSQLVSTAAAAVAARPPVAISALSHPPPIPCQSTVFLLPMRALTPLAHLAGGNLGGWHLDDGQVGVG